MALPARHRHPGLSVEVRRAPSGLTTIEVAGELDFHTAPRLRAALLAATSEDRPMVVLDLGRLSFMDSTGFGICVIGRKQALANDGALGLAALTDWVAKMLAMAGLTRVFDIFDTVELAEAAIVELVVARGVRT